ncbi:MAG: transporter substrate-binding protein [Betaproteobacteria bacterium]|nr:transporter substrate-binding protein [Betaproteobacteria bacterium]
MPAFAAVLFVLGISMLGLGEHAVAAEPLQPSVAAAKTYAMIPANKDDDLKFYAVDGRIAKGADALSRMRQDAGLVLWVAGNQFFAMDAVIGAFQAQNPGLAVGLITLPPGLLLDAILKGGWRYQGSDYPGQPDIYASVSLEHLQKLKRASVMDDYHIYMHNEMVLMVAKGNPKSVRGIADLARGDLRTSMPNPVNEGIMQFYARKVLERHQLWATISAGQECYACQTTPNNWFTQVHHRETPERIRDGKSDTGIVWVTEAIEAERAGMPVESVKLPPQDSLRDEVSYAIGVLNNSRRPAAAQKYFDFLKTPAGKNAYSSFGFVYATEAELTRKPIP